MMNFKEFNTFKNIEHNLCELFETSITKLYDFDDNLLKEGLVSSFKIDKFNDFLNRLLLKYTTDFEIYLDGETSILEMNNFHNLNKGDRRKIFDGITMLLKQSGYYISCEDDYGHLVEFINTKKEYIHLEFNMKFNSTRGIPIILYHVTYPMYYEKIKKNGLVPKSKKTIDNHPDRIYLTSNVIDAVKFAKANYFITNDESKKKYIILEIHTSKLKHIKLYDDPLKIDNTKMYYTYDNIPNYALGIYGEFTIKK